MVASPRRLALPKDTLQQAGLLGLQERMSRDLFSLEMRRRREEDTDALASILGGEEPDAVEVTGATGYESMLQAPSVRVDGGDSGAVDDGQQDDARPRTPHLTPTVEMPGMGSSGVRRRAVYDPEQIGEVTGPADLDPIELGTAARRGPTELPTTQVAGPAAPAPPIGGKNPAVQDRIYRQARASGLDDEAARVLVAVAETEGGMEGARGDRGQAIGVYQFHSGGEYPGFRAWLQRQGIQGDPAVLAVDPEVSTRYAAEGYLGRAIAEGRAQGLSGADLATYVQQHGQRSIAPETTGANYTRLFGQGARPGAAPAEEQPRAQVQTAVAIAGQFTRNQGEAGTALGLSWERTLEICGPIAAAAFLRATGRLPGKEEAESMRVAQERGYWQPGRGMGGPGTQSQLLTDLGVANRLEQGVDWRNVQADVQRGNPVIVDTPGHYYVVEGYNPQTGQYDLGESARFLTASGGRRWFRPEEIPSLGMGAPRAAIYLDNPETPAPSAVAGRSDMQRIPLNVGAASPSAPALPSQEPAGVPPAPAGSDPLDDVRPEMQLGAAFNDTTSYRQPLDPNAEAQADRTPAPDSSEWDAPPSRGLPDGGRLQPAAAPASDDPGGARFAAEDSRSTPPSWVWDAPPSAGLSNQGRVDVPPAPYAHPSIAAPDTETPLPGSPYAPGQQESMETRPDRFNTAPQVRTVQSTPGEPDYAPTVAPTVTQTVIDAATTPARRVYSRAIQEAQEAEDEFFQNAAPAVADFSRETGVPLEQIHRGMRIARDVILATPQATADTIDAVLSPIGLGRNQVGVTLPVFGNVGIADIVDIKGLSFIGVGRSSRMLPGATQFGTGLAGAIERGTGAVVRGVGRGLGEGSSAVGRGARAIGQEAADQILEAGMGPRMVQPGPRIQAPQLATPEPDIPAPTFFSQLHRTLEEKMPNRAMPAQVQGILKGGAVKPDEIKWTGLDDWLAEQRGPVTKQQVLDFLDQNEVRVEEVVKGGSLSSVERERLRVLDLRDRYPEGHPQALTVAERSEAERLREGFPDTRYDEYTMPGGKNYRELLLTLRDRGASAREAWKQQHERVLRLEYAFGKDDPQVLAERAELKRLGQELGNPPEPYRSSHWDEPNVLAHVRFNERVAPDGKRVLLIEEVQSDWHQAGRKQGYQGKVHTPEAWDDLTRRMGDARARYGDDSPQVRALEEQAQRWNADDNSRAMGAVPDAPFQKTWPELAIKRMIRWAAENDFDRLAWLPGSVHAERFRQDGIDRAVGMSGFYDQIVPAVVNKIGKKFGARVSQSEIAVPSAKIEGEDVLYRVFDDAGDEIGEFYDEMAARRLAEDYGGTHERVDEFTPARIEPVHSMDVTPEMRASVVKQGQPLFAGAPFDPAGAAAGGAAGAMTGEEEEADPWRTAAGVLIGGILGRKRMTAQEREAWARAIQAAAKRGGQASDELADWARRHAQGRMDLGEIDPLTDAPRTAGEMTPRAISDEPNAPLSVERALANQGVRQPTMPGVETPVTVRPAREAIDDLIPRGGPEGTLKAPPRYAPATLKTFQERIRDPEKAEAAASEYQKLMDEGASPSALAAYVRNAEDSRWWDRFDTLRYASMLSDPVTHGQNALGSVQLGVVDLVERPLTALLDRGRAAVTGGSREVFMSEAAALPLGMARAAPGAFHDALFILQHGLRPEDIAKLDRRTRGFATDIPGLAPRGSRAATWLDRGMEMPLRALGAADAFFRGSFRAGHLAAEATNVLQRQNGGKPVTPEAVRKFLENPSIEVADVAENRAAMAVLQEHRQTTDAINQMRGKLHPVGQAMFSVAVPYIRTPFNIVAQGLGMTPPFGFVALAEELGMLSRFGGRAERVPIRDIERRASRLLIGTTIMAWASWENLEGRNTGSYPESEAERSTLPPGWRPYARKIEIGSETYYVPLVALGPLGIPAMVSILATEQVKKKQSFTMETAAALAEGVGQLAEDQTFLRSLSDLGKGLSGRGDAGQDYLEQLVSQFSPHVIGGGGVGRRIAAVRGEPSRDPEGVMEAWLATLPYGDRVARALGVEPAKVRRDAIGRPRVENPDGLAALVPIRSSRENDEPVIAAYRRAGEGLPRNAPKTVRDPDTDRPVTLTRAQQAQWQVVFGQAVDDEWRARGRPRDIDELQKIEREARERAKDAVLRR